MVGDTVEKKLYDAASNGALATLQGLLNGGTSSYLLGEVSFACSRSLLHVATMHGQLDIVKEIVTRKPELARNLDSQNLSPLHMAAAQGHLEIAGVLLLAAPEVCWWRDWQGMNPVHVAAMNGHVEILKLLVGLDRFPAAERLDRGQTVLHLCVKHRRLAAFEFLVEKLRELVCLEDDDGETVVHSAIRFKQVEVIRYMEQKNKLDQLSSNSKGKTIVQVYRESLPHDRDSLEIRKILLRKPNLFDRTFLGKFNDMTMVVMVLIATMAFQAGISPPGGVWQDDSFPLRKAGEAVMASNSQKIFTTFKQANTVAFASSLFAIILITTGLPLNEPAFMALVLCVMWASVASIAVSYGASLLVITPNTETESLSLLIGIIVIVSIGVCFFCIVWTYLRWLCERIKRTRWWMAIARDNYQPDPESTLYPLQILVVKLLRQII